MLRVSSKTGGSFIERGGEELTRNEKIEGKIQEVLLQTVTKKADADHKQMKAAVYQWKLSEQEQTVREKNIPYILKWFSPRVSTIGPLVNASATIRETQNSTIILGDVIDSFTGRSSYAQKRKSEIESEVDSLIPDVSHKVIDEAGSENVEWKHRSQIRQLFTNKKESPVYLSMQKKLLDEAKMWSEYHELENSFESETASVGSEQKKISAITRFQKEEQRLLCNQATWNVYSKVAVNMALTAGAVGGAAYLVRNGGYHR